MNIKIVYLTYCPHSREAVETFNKLNIPYKEQIADDNKEQVKQKYRLLNNGYTQFPQIYIDNIFLGGNAKLQEIIKIIKTANIPSTPEYFSRKKWLKFIRDFQNYL